MNKQDHHHTPNHHHTPCPPKVVYFTYMQVVTDDEGKTHLVTPHDDPMQYEFAIDFIWQTKKMARDWLKNEAADWSIEAEEAAEWSLVKVTQEIV
jgi:hypothetical protein